VPSITGRNNHGIDILSIEKFAKIAMQFAIGVSIVFIDECLARIAPTCLNVGDCNALDIGKAEHGLQIISASRSDADDAKRDLVARSNGTAASEHA